MPNPYFTFKQFTIHQHKSAMKVCTDACLFGAWVANFFKEYNHQINKILDIGTGTGLLTLMLAQQLTPSIDAIEIDQNAYLQATDNINESEWRQRINIINGDIKQYLFDHPYDLIISNPPFYENDLHAQDLPSNRARHDESLTLTSLLNIVTFILAPRGSFAVLIPFHRLDYCLQTASGFNLFPKAVVNVKQSTRHNYFRSMVVFTNNVSENIYRSELVMKDGEKYSAEFTELLKDYYLYL